MTALGFVSVAKCLQEGLKYILDAREQETTGDMSISRGIESMGLEHLALKENLSNCTIT